MQPIDLAPDGRLVVLTGAGISADSGLDTFRGTGGLWDRYDVYELASPQGFARDPALVWRFYGHRRRAASQAQPNGAHTLLAGLETRLGPERFALVTQNVDELHQRAGSQDLLALHGSLFRTRCSNADCPASRAPFDDASDHADAVPRCDQCDQPLRPDVVWFGEMLDPDVLDAAHARTSRATVFLAIGTSGAVYPAAGFVEVARAAGAQTVLVNREPADNAGRFGRFVQGRAVDVLPLLFPSGG